VTPLELTINIAPLKAELTALKKRLSLANNNYEMVQKLYNRGLESQQNLNKQEEERAMILSDIEVVKAKLASLNQSKKNTKNRYKIHAGASGRVEKVLVSPNAVVDANTPLLSIVKGEESFLVKSYVPLRYLNEIRIGLKGTLFYGGKSYAMHLTQILPALDEKTQQMVVLSTLDTPVKNLLVNAYVDSELSLGEAKRYLSVKKTALSFFNNEWVVFVPEHHEEEEEHEDEHENEAEHHEEEEHEKHGHGHEHEAQKVPYGIRVVKIIKENQNFVAIEGLKEHEAYVSDKSYYVKSLLLKSALGGHGH
jgi:multidrug efflux pump subunit AcrA (membrane-fusion protein)